MRFFEWLPIRCSKIRKIFNLQHNFIKHKEYIFCNFRVHSNSSQILIYITIKSSLSHIVYCQSILVWTTTHEGMRHSAAFRSNSRHSAVRNSPGRTGQKTKRGESLSDATTTKWLRWPYIEHIRLRLASALRAQKD